MLRRSHDVVDTFVDCRSLVVAFAFAFGAIAVSSLTGHGKAGLTGGGDDGSGLGIPGLGGDTPAVVHHHLLGPEEQEQL
jgi:hypothetical protein